MPDVIYFWLIRDEQVRDTVFMNEFAEFLHKNENKFHSIILHTSNDIPEKIYFQAKRISGFLSENLLTNSVFHLHQWGLVNRQANDYILNREKLSKVFKLSSAVVFTNIWQDISLSLSEVGLLLQQIPVKKAFIFANNPHLNIHTQDYTQVNAYPDEATTAIALQQVSSFFETWVSHLNNIAKTI